MADTSDLLQLAEAKTRKLTPAERRAVMSYLDENPDAVTGTPYDTTQGLADLFQVTGAVVRSDRKAIADDYASEITPDSAMRFVGRHLQAHDKLLVEAYKGLKCVDVGTLAHREYCALVSKLEDKKLTMLQSIGVIQKELGRLQTVEEIWEATVSEDGVTVLREVKPDEDRPDGD